MVIVDLSSDAFQNVTDDLLAKASQFIAASQFSSQFWLKPPSPLVTDLHSS